MPALNKAYIKRVTREEFLISSQLLPKINDAYGSKFNRLILPEPLFACLDQHNQYTILVNFYEGENYNGSWNEQTGGGLVGLELVDIIVATVEDLLKIDIEYVEGSQEAKEISCLSFDFSTWRTSYQNRLDHATNFGFSKDMLEEANIFLKKNFSQDRFIFSNGDFYPRNLINVMGGQKTVVIDWGYWGQNFRANYVDHLENIIAFAYIHMWGNRDWQNKFLKTVIGKFDIRLDDLRKSIMIKSFEQAFIWCNHPQLSNFQVELFKRALYNQDLIS